MEKVIVYGMKGDNCIDLNITIIYHEYKQGGTDAYN